jgi:ATP diphosphatase
MHHPVRCQAKALRHNRTQSPGARRFRGGRVRINSTKSIIEVTVMEKILQIMRRLRDPDNGCPWDLEQSFASIVPHTIEEAYEVADCIERGALDELPGELGDLLFQVVFYSQLGREQGLFDFEDVTAVLAKKLTQRHPHVFADAPVLDANAQAQRWEEYKAAEREQANDGAQLSELDGVPRDMPALTRAKKLQQRASRVGFDWPSIVGVRAKVLEEFGELDAAIEEEASAEIEEEFGDLLFACVNWARHLGVEPESALRAASRKFERRFNYIERTISASGDSLSETSLERMDALWDAVKQIEKSDRKPG